MSPEDEAIPKEAHEISERIENKDSLKLLSLRLGVHESQKEAPKDATMAERRKLYWDWFEKQEPLEIPDKYQKRIKKWPTTTMLMPKKGAYNPLTEIHYRDDFESILGSIDTHEAWKLLA